ncbi:MAG TPA: hypothetical protein V6D06_05675 [Trichocoleus sp.]
MQDFEPAQPNKPKSGTPWKWVAIGCGGCLGLSVLLTAAIAYFASRALNFSMDPQAVEGKAQELFDYEIPGESRGLLNMNIMGIELTQVADTQEPPGVLLTMGQLPNYLRDENAQTSFIESFQQEMAQDGGYQLQVERTETLPLCGQSVSVRIAEGTFEGTETTQAVSYLAVVEHEGSERFAWIVANGDTADSMARGVFDSLVCK